MPASVMPQGNIDGNSRFELTDKAKAVLSYGKLRSGILGHILTDKAFAAMDEPIQAVVEHFSTEEEYTAYIQYKIDWDGNPLRKAVGEAS